MYDVAVVGLGIMGSAAAYEIARRGKQVVGLEQFARVHDRGSSHGETRAFRLAHFEGKHYSRLAQQALQGWRRLEGETGTRLLTTNGILECGPEASEYVEKSIKAAKDNNLAFEELTSKEVGERYPAFQLPKRWRNVFHPGGGFLRPELAVHCFQTAAKKMGADLHFHRHVKAVEPKDDFLRIVTEGRPIRAKVAVITSGPWIGELVLPLAPYLTLTREVQLWFKPVTPDLFTPERFPVFALYDRDDLVYGFPDVAGSGVKSASHRRGRELPHAAAAQQDGSEEDATSVRRVISRHLSGLDSPVIRAETCIYTNTPDEAFIIDRSPEDERIVFASACSGHGFKYASVIGEILADLALDGDTKHKIGEFRISRFD